MSERLNPTVIELLNKRGIIEEDDIKEFISSLPKKTYDPFLLRNMEEAVDIILDFAYSKKKICIYGDYDVDGITSVAILMQTLGKITSNTCFYIPSRFDEGYGLNKEAIKQIVEKGAELIVTVDCGSVSHSEVEFAKSLGIEIIVTDHHNIDDRVADCLIINPKQTECKYPFKGLAGCGVAFKLACALQKKAGLEKKIIREILDLVGIGTVGDIVPLIDENRTLVKFGLKAIKETKRKGLKKLIEKLALKQEEICSENIAFVIVPHLNAAGRVRDAALCVKILLSDDDKFVDEGVDELIRYNRERRLYQDQAYEKCVDIVENHMKDRNFILIKCLDVHEGITGIVAGKLKDKYNRPVAIVTPATEGFKGTSRSINNINIYDIMKQHEDYFEKFGGHGAACGFMMQEENIKKLSDSLENTITDMINKDNSILNDKTNVDMEIELQKVTLELFDDIQLLAPFGHKNKKPVFEIKNVIMNNIFYVGADNKHVKFDVTDRCGNYAKCILFNRTKDNDDLIGNNKSVDIIGSLDGKVWRDKREVQIIVNSIE